MYDPYSKGLLKETLAKIEVSDDLDLGIKLTANYKTITDLFRKLYGHREDATARLELLLNRITTNYIERSQALKKVDLDREQDPKWFLGEGIVGMSLYVDKFSGTLKKFQTHIDYFQNLGVNLLHLMPLMKCPDIYNDGGYAVSDFRQVNPGLGDMEDIRNISAEFRKRGMYLMLDLAINHTSEEHAWALKAQQGEVQFQEYYYCFDDRSIPDQFDQHMPWVFPDMAPGNFTYNDIMQKWVMTVFHEYQWDLNYTNPMVFIEMLDNLLFLANNGVDIIRLDALAFTWKEIGTSGQNLEKAHLLMQLFKACAQVVSSGVLFLAEAIVAPNDIIGYFGHPRDGNNNECDLAYNATLMTLLWESIVTRNSKLLNISLDNIPAKPFGTTWLNYIRCHDDIGLGYDDLHAQWAGYNPYDHRTFLINFLSNNHEWSFSKGRTFMRKAENDARISGTLASLVGLEKALDENNDAAIDLAIKRIELMIAVVVSYGGIPMLYMGDELGVTNDYSILEQDDLKHDNRWLHRPKMDWEKAENAGKPHTVENRIFSGTKKLIELRKQTPEFADINNVRRVQTGNDHLFAFLRAKGVYRTLCVYNLNDHPEPFFQETLINNQFDLSKKLINRISEEYVTFDTGRLLLAPYELLWLNTIN